LKKNNGKTASFWKEESGDFGIKQIAATVAVIVIIGFIVTAIQTNIGTWVNQVWTLFMDQIRDSFS
jgi:hypothetical protein